MLTDSGRWSRLAVAVSVAAIVGLAAGTVTAAAQNAVATQNLVDSGWEVASIMGTPTIPLPVLTMQFNSNGWITGFSGVNNYSAPYTVGQNMTLSIGRITSTKMAGRPSLMAEEKNLLAALGKVTCYKYEGQYLVLSDAAAARLIVLTNVFLQHNTSAGEEPPVVTEPTQNEQVGPSIVVTGSTSQKRLMVVKTWVYAGNVLVGVVPGIRHWTKDDGSFRLTVATPRVSHATLAETRYEVHVFTLSRKGHRGPEAVITCYPQQ